MLSWINIVAVYSKPYSHAAGNVVGGTTIIPPNRKPVSLSRTVCVHVDLCNWFASLNQELGEIRKETKSEISV